MSGQEDYNEFNSWDSGGAAFMLALVPAVIYFVFTGHDYVGTAVLAAVAGLVALVVFLIARFTSSRVVSRIMQLVGIGLCIVYWIYAFHMWTTHSRFATDVEAPTAEQQETTPQ